MDGKTIKQIADELRVSKQAVWQRVKRSEELSAMLADHSENVNGTIHVDDVLEQRIKEQYPERNTPETVDDTSVNIDETTVNSSETVDETTVNVDETTVNSSETVDETTVNVDETTVNSSETVDETTVNIDKTTVNVDINTLIVTLQNTVDTLQQQLTVKDKQIDELTTMLKSSQEQQATLVTALSAAQALHAGTIQERLTEHSGSSEEQAETKAADSVPDEIRKSAQELQQKRKGFFARIIRRK